MSTDTNPDEQLALPVAETDVRHPVVEKVSDQLPEEDPTVRRVQRFTGEFEVPADVTPLPLRSANQQQVLFNLCHLRQRPRSKYPGFRILGCFPSVNEAASFANEHYPPGVETVFAAPVHQLIPICSSDEHQGDEVYCRDHVSRLIDLHTEDVKKRHEDFEKTLTEQGTGSVGNSIEARRKQASNARRHNGRVRALEAKFDVDCEQCPTTSGTLSGNHTIAGQQYAVIVFLPDIRRRALQGNEDLQPMFAVLFVGTEKDCETYAKYTANPAYKDCVIDIVSMYAWCFPEHIESDKIGSEAYGNQKLNNIMQARKQNMTKLEEYSNLIEENKEQMVVELNEGDLLK